MTTPKPWWVQQRRFAIPSTLRDRIEGLPDEERLRYCFIVNKVRYETRAEPTKFQSISSTYFRNFVGGHYRRYVEKLQEWSIIHVLDSYQNNQGHGSCKPYRLHHSALESPIVKVRFAKKQAQPLKDHSTLTDDVAVFVHANCQRLGIKNELAPQPNDVAEVDAEDFAERIYWGQFNVRYGQKVQRMFHTVIEMPSAARKNLFLKESPTTPLFEYDVKSCHPVLLLQMMEDPKEQDKLSALLTDDFYTAVATETGVARERDIIKKDFLKFANGRTKNYFHRYFNLHFPNLTQFLDEHKSGVAAFGQNAEAWIMTEEVPRWLMASVTPKHAQPLNIPEPSTSSLTSRGNPENVFYIPMHDGWLGIEKDELWIGNYVRDRFFAYTRFWVTITKTDLASGQETILLQGAPAVAVEPPPIHG